MLRTPHINTTILIEIWAVISAALIAYLISRPAESPKPVHMLLLSLAVSVGLLIADRALWANTKMGIFDHATCLVAPKALACVPERQAPPVAQSSKPTLTSPSLTESGRGALAFNPAGVNTRPYNWDSKGCHFGEIGQCFSHIDVRSYWDKTVATLKHSAECSNGNFIACSEVGYLKMNGKGPRNDDAGARTLFKKACEGGDTMAFSGDARGCNGLGYLMAKGRGGSKDLTNARSFFVTACGQEYPLGCANLKTLDSQSALR